MDIEIIPGIFEEQILPIEKKIALVSSLVSSVQIDIADGTFIPKTTPTKQADFQEILSKYPQILFEAHLMVNEPDKYVGPLVGSGFRRLIAHIESDDPRRFLEKARYEAVEVGLAIDAPTDLEQIEPFLDEIDLVLVMTAPAGLSGQPFMPENLEKVKTIRQNYPDLPIEVDCGINDRTARTAKDAGANRLVSTSYLFSNPINIQNSINTLRKVSRIEVDMDLS